MIREIPPTPLRYLLECDQVEAQTARQAEKRDFVEEHSPTCQMTMARAKSVLITSVERLRPQGDSPLSGLTPKQTEVLELVAGGHNNDSIANELEISTRTVDRHLNEICRHLRSYLAPGVHARVHAVLLLSYATQKFPAG
jgi:DNA-binding NarL/FixJ family response regulator